MITDRFKHFITTQKLTSKSLCWTGIIQEALNRGLSVKVLGEKEINAHGLVLSYGTRLGNVFTLTDGNKTILFNKSYGREVDCIQQPTPKSKFAFKKTLQRLEINTAAGDLITPGETQESLLAKAQVIGFPLVLKPDQGSMGKGVFVDLKSPEELLRAYTASTTKKNLLLEQFICGAEYRVYLVGGRFITACKRVNAQVYGDGKSSIRSLIKVLNAKKLASGFDQFRIDEQAILLLQQQNLQLDTVLAPGQFAVLNKKLGRSSGGNIAVAADDFSQQLRCQLEKLAACFSDKAVLGVDVLLKDNMLYVIELNIRPQLSSAMLPDTGASVDLPGYIVSYFFPASPKPDTYQLFNAASILHTLKSNPTSSINLD